MPLPFFCLLFWKKLWKIVRDGVRLRFALADRGLDSSINLLVSVAVALTFLKNKNPEDHEKSSGLKSYSRSYPVVSYIFNC